MKDSLLLVDVCVMVAVLTAIEFDVVVLAPELADAGVMGAVLGVVDVVVVVDVAVVHACVSAKRHIA